MFKNNNRRFYANQSPITAEPIAISFAFPGPADYPRVIIGDNFGSSEVWLVRNKLHPEMNKEESVSIRAVRRVYAQHAGIEFDQAPEPKDIFEIGMGRKPGNREAAIIDFETMVEALGDAMANVLTLID